MFTADKLAAGHPTPANPILITPMPPSTVESPVESSSTSWTQRRRPFLSPTTAASPPPPPDRRTLENMTSKEETFSAKPAKFNGTYFKRWQSQIKFWLTTLGLISAIDGSTPISNDSDETESDVGVSKSFSSTKPKTPKEIDYHCFQRILSVMSESLYNIFFEYKSAKELWDALKDEYGCDDAGIDRFNSTTFNQYVMVDNKPINDQIHEFQEHLRQVQARGTFFSTEHKT
ncbi:uncharacterized protein M6B38_373615 [Iris pallida]|uniref:UBN2_3 domain-containing protein n=1 Tax=Iris pallida TaxID=29817 RepID=A0AAX6GDB7_IRIPA|nr:uncharacterized protein M6B38_373615 [Iris pallida]